MKECLNIALCGGWAAHAADFARRIQKTQGARITSVWDENEDFSKALAGELGCCWERDYAAILADSDIDGVIITSRTSRHAELTIAAAKAQKNIYLEKAPAVCNEEIYAMRDIVISSGIHFTISDPMEKPHFMYAKNLLDSGKLGKPTLLRYRLAHDGAVQGSQWYLWPRFYDKGEGGAMMDIGCHAVHLLTLILGRPVRCCSSIGYFTEIGRQNGIDENAVAVYEFENGAVGIAEVSWVTPNLKPGFEFSLYCTNGIVQIIDGHLRYVLDDGVPSIHGKDLFWHDVLPDEYPEAQQHPMFYWLDSIRYNTKNEKHDIAEAVRFTEMISAAYQASNLGVRM